MAKYLHRQGKNSSPYHSKGHPTSISSQATEAQVVDKYDPTQDGLVLLKDKDSMDFRWKDLYEELLRDTIPGMEAFD